MAEENAGAGLMRPGLFMAGGAVSWLTRTRAQGLFRPAELFHFLSRAFKLRVKEV